ncbi:MAG: MBL fold metallo-hydrolase [Opitutaceae bacterium]|nr:MBL fold metallo-hydrolase [Opitutaceae bacterium]
MIENGVFRLRDSCNVYAVHGSEGAWLVVNAGTAAAAEKFGEIGDTRKATVLLTHHFRDHAAGAAEFRRRGARIGGPWHDREHLSGGQRAMRTKQTLYLYDLMWDHYAPFVPLAVDRWMMDYERTTLAGLPVEVVPTPAATMGATTYVVTVAGGRRLAFTGELMSSPGKVPRLSPLQYNYNDLTGLENVLLSWERVLAADPDLALPSFGEPFTDCVRAGELLRKNIAGFEPVHPGITARIARPSRVTLEEVLPRLYRANGASAETHFLVGRSGRLLAIDFGYDTLGVRFPNRLESWARRPLLHSLAALQEKTGATRIDTVIPTHYHDDHVAGIPLLQRLFGTELWAGENFADLLERPQDFDRPCLWPEPMKVSSRLPLGRTFYWEDIAITLYPMAGHTEFSTLICLEFDGHRIAHTGDQIFYYNPDTMQLTAPENGGVFTNHVYRNGLALGGYVDCVQRLREFDPELILSGHYAPYRPTPELWQRLAAAARTFDEAHRAIMPLASGDAHFGADSVAAKIVPHQLAICAGSEGVQFQGWVLNPFGFPAQAEVQFRSAADLTARPLQLMLAPRAKQAFASVLSTGPNTTAGRHLLVLDLVVDGKPFGQVAEAWVTVS